jgi:hypothetical protein
LRRVAVRLLRLIEHAVFNKPCDFIEKAFFNIKRKTFDGNAVLNENLL